MLVNKNQVKLRGTIVGEPEFSHETHDEKFYYMTCESERRSGNIDALRIMVSEKLFNEDLNGQVVEIEGQIRTFNIPKGDGKSSLKIFLFVQKLDIVKPTDDISDYNEVELEGFICRTPNYRKTPLGREVCDLLIAVNRGYGKSDYLPCITWGRNARWAGDLVDGDKVSITGRFQSRVYSKKIDDEKYEDRTAYEISVQSINILEE